MHLALDLEEKQSELAHVDKAIADLIANISVSDVANDPALILTESSDSFSEEKVPQSLSLHQLNAKLQDLEFASNQLNEFWIIKNMFREVQVGLESASNTELACGKEELASLVFNLQKLNDKISKMTQSKLAISVEMRAQYSDFLSKFSNAVNSILHMFAPQVSNAKFIVNHSLDTTEGPFVFKDFVEICSDFDTIHPECKFSETLGALKASWADLVLEPLISKRCLLSTRNESENRLILDVIPLDSVSEFSMHSYLESLQCFIHFVNTTGLKSFKNSFSTKVSNSLSEVIPEHIVEFSNEENNLTQKLISTLGLLSSSGWAVPLRNIFMAHNDIHESLRGLHLNWVVDKYIDQSRSVFTAPSFDNDLRNQRTISQTIEVKAPVTKEQHVSNVAEAQDAPPVPPTDTMSEEIAWDDDWGSDEDDQSEKATKASVHSDAWDENWDDSWSDDDGDHHGKAARNTNTGLKDFDLKKTEASFKQANSNDQPRPQESPQSHFETHTLVVSAVSDRIAQTLAEFDQESAGADPRDLIDAIFSMALASYPPVSQSFLIYNDLRNVACNSSYLRECVDTEWMLFCQSFSADISKILSAPGSMDSVAPQNDFEGEGSFTSIGQISVLMNGLVNSGLYNTNSPELKSFVLQVLNFVNTIVLQKILRCEEITEYQSEEFTLYLESLQRIEQEVLAKFNEDAAVLATTNKVMQTKFLINNHLKSIMEYFYQGELYDFSTDELVSVLKSVFIPSELRENCLREIIDVRNS